MITWLGLGSAASDVRESHSKAQIAGTPQGQRVLGADIELLFRDRGLRLAGAIVGGRLVREQRELGDLGIEIGIVGAQRHLRQHAVLSFDLHSPPLGILV